MIRRRGRSSAEAPTQGGRFAEAVARVRSAPDELAAATEDLVSELTDDELLGVLDGDEPLLAGLRSFARDGYNHTPIVAGAVARLGIPGIRFTDGPRGIVMGRSTAFPVAMARGATWDPELERRIGEAIGLEGRAQGANLFAGICINLLRHPAWGRAQETYGEDPVLLGTMGAALADGVRTQLMACVKHFALNSMENSRFQVDVQVDDDVLHEVYLPHFRTVVESGVDAVMSGYNAVNGTWCGDHPVLLTEILRDEWGFEGFVMSDFLFGHRDPIGSVAAGLDLEMPFVQQRAVTLPKALRSGELRRSDALRAARRLIGAQIRWAARSAEEAPPVEVVASAPHRALARRAASQGMVLLRNETVDHRPLLPIDPADVRRLAVIGRLATAANLGDEGSSQVRPPDTVTILDGLTEVFEVVEHDDGGDIGRAATLARTCDAVVLVAGYTARDEGEALFSMDRATMQLLPSPVGGRVFSRVGSGVLGLLGRLRASPGGDRARLTLHDHDEELIAAVADANPRTVVVLIAGSAVLTETWRDRVPAVLMAWYPGMEGGRALAEVLTGATEPGGRLPFAVPTDPGHLPHFDHDARLIRCDRWWGQRRLDRDRRVPAFPFGFGLGYTTFVVDEVTVEDVDIERFVGRASVTLRNTGPRRGATVVQLYASGDAGRRRPRRQLVGFQRVELDPGESTAITAELDLRPLTERDPHTGAWTIAPADYLLEAGRHSGDPDAATAPLLRADPRAR